MHKLTLLATAAVLGLSSFAIPAQAAGICNTDDDYVADRASSIAERLDAQGYNVVSVEGWGGCAAVVLIDADGARTSAVFDPTTLDMLSGDYAEI